MIDAMCARVESLCRRIAPQDLGDTPLYIVPQSRLPDGLGGKACCDGFTAPCLDLYLQDAIGSAWRGRGGCIVVDDTDANEQTNPECLELDVRRTVLHELAHILERPAIYRDREGENPDRILFEALVLGHTVAAEPVESATSFQGHGARFIRAALHLRYRAERLGALVPLFCYCAGNQYGLSHPNRYRQALGDEPARLADVTIRDILGTPYPEAFWRLWTSDMARWLSNGQT